ncbi:MAG: phosphotransferase [Silvibacterium sp.]|nr:phosphotransferase [Silvibacterium sp.]
MDDLSRRAVSAALAVARGLGLPCSDQPEILADGSNVLAHLVPAPVVARVATTTALVRRPPERWLARDLNIGGYLAARSFPVVPPSRELPPGPHLHDGFALTFWEFIEHDRNYVASAPEVGPFLRDLHTALRDYGGPLRHLSPFAEIPEWLDEVGSWNPDEVASWNPNEVASWNTDQGDTSKVNPADIAILRRGFAQVSADINELNLPERPLHGDAHKKNVLKTSRGLLWTDFEDACCGPLEWDLACFVRTSLESPDIALASYAAHINPDHLQPFFAARDLQGAAWGLILSTRFPDRKARADEWMAIARSRYGG